MIEGISPPSDGNWHYEHITPDLLQAERVDRVIYSARTQYQSMVIQDTACFGRSLVLDDKTQSTELDEFVYHESLVQPPMLAHEAPKRVFVAGGGEGATIREVLAHESVERVVMADIDREVVEACRQYLPSFHRGAFDDPRLDLLHVDALAYLQDTAEPFDVAIIDVPDPLEGGPAYVLYTREFYELLRDRLGPGGIFVAQSGPTGPAFYEQCFSAVASTIGSVFDGVSAYEAFVPSFGSTWGFVVGSLGRDPASMEAPEVDQLLKERVSGPLRHYDGTAHEGMFALPKYLRKAMADETRVITKADPLFVT